MKPKLIIVTGNSLKFRELSTELSRFFDCEQKVFENYNEIQGYPEEIITHKLKNAYEFFQAPVLVDDTSVHFDALNGFPGPYIRDFIRHMPIYDMGMKFAGTRIKISCRLGFYDGVNEKIIATGTIGGDVIVPQNIDPGPKEFDLFVQIDGTDKPMIEFTPEEKNKISHRGYALQDLICKLESRKK